MSHRVEPCDWPIKSRRWRNSIWVCPKCGKAWTLVKASTPTPNGPGWFSEGPFWTWWEWPWEK